MTEDIALPARLDEDLLFIVELAQDCINNFINRNHPHEHDLIMKWFNYLITIDCKNSLEERRKRNTLVCRLVNCLQTLQLSETFQKPPDPMRALPKIELPPINDTQWADDQNGPEAGELFGRGGKDCRTYVSTKFLDQNRGACGYIGLSSQNEGDTDWVFDGKNDAMKEKYREIETFQEEEKRKFCLYIIDCINQEMHGSMDPYTNNDLEGVIEEFIEINKDSDVAHLFQDGGEEGRRNLLYLILNRLYKAYPSKSNKEAAEKKKKEEEEKKKAEDAKK